jgi:hypothetical protein
VLSAKKKTLLKQLKSAESVTQSLRLMAGTTKPKWGIFATIKLGNSNIEKLWKSI